MRRSRGKGKRQNANWSYYPLHNCLCSRFLITYFNILYNLYLGKLYSVSQLASYRETQLVCHLRTQSSSFVYKSWNNKPSCEIVCKSLPSIRFLFFLRTLNLRNYHWRSKIRCLLTLILNLILILKLDTDPRRARVLFSLCLHNFFNI